MLSLGSGSLGKATTCMERLLVCRCHCVKKTDNDVVIVSAVRTPIANFEDLSSVQLSAVALEAAWKQSALPVDYIQKIYMRTLGWESVQSEDAYKMAASYAGFSKTKYDVVQNNTDTNTLKLATTDLQANRAQIVIAGATEYFANESSISINADIANRPSDYYSERFELTGKDIASYYWQNHNQTTLARAAGIFEDEIVPVQIQKDRKMLVKTCDEREVQNTYRKCVDGAAALVLSTAGIAKSLEIKPLARLIDYETVKVQEDHIPLAPMQAVQNLLLRTRLTIQDIARWEVHAWTPEVILAFAKAFYIDANKINLHGASTVLSNPYSLAGICLTTHLAHTLEPGKLGCAVISHASGITSTILVEKTPLDQSNDLPKITLYTKDNCGLCDELVEELEAKFPGEFQLEKVYIDKKINVRYLRLYRYEIPVLFLNGQFLCMHKLNANLVRRRLNLLKNKLSDSTK